MLQVELTTKLKINERDTIQPEDARRLDVVHREYTRIIDVQIDTTPRDGWTKSYMIHIKLDKPQKYSTAVKQIND